jgi:hypothetical protein
MASSAIYPAGEAVVFTTLKPNRIQLFEVETGKRLLAGRLPGGVDRPGVHVGRRRPGPPVRRAASEAYDLPSGKLRWRQLIPGRHAEPRGSRPRAGLPGDPRIGASSDERLFLETISLRTGKIVQQKEPRSWATPLFMQVDGDQAIVVSRGARQAVTVRGVALSDFSVRWTTPLGAATRRCCRRR